jgi:hypothetical protein
MNRIDADIHDFEAARLIRKLIEFLGTSNIERCLAGYEKSLSCAGPIYREYYLKSRHPWWEALKTFFELERKGRSVKRNLDSKLKRLAGDAHKLSILQKNMPEKIRSKFKRDLVDENRAYDYLFELQIAWHCHLQGYGINWYEEDGCPEFLVKTPQVNFNVECKRISVDGSRKIRRRDFYRLTDILLPKVEKMNIKGSIDIELDARLHSSYDYLENLSFEILDCIKSHAVGSYPISYGTLVLGLSPKNNEVIDFERRNAELQRRKSHESHAAIFAKGKNGKPVDPIELTIKSRKADKVLDGIKKRIQKAATNQLPPSTPGIITCFLESITELNSLASNSGLQMMSSYLLGKEENSHVAAISYCSEERIMKNGNTEKYDFQGLLFRNPNCSFNEIKNFPFLSKEMEM